MIRAFRSTTEKDSGGLAICSATALDLRSKQESIELAEEKKMGDVERWGMVAISLKNKKEHTSTSTNLQVLKSYAG